MIIEDIKTLEDGIEFLKIERTNDKEKTEQIINGLQEQLKQLKSEYDFDIDSLRKKTNWYFVHLFAKDWESMKENYEKSYFEFEENEETFVVYLANEDEIITWEYHYKTGNRTRFVHDTKKIASISSKVL